MLDNEIAIGLQDLLQKVEGSLIPALEGHAESKEFNAAKDGLDFLEVKNSMMLSYMIELTKELGDRLGGKKGGENMERLIEMKVALEKMRPMEKKMRYQLDKLLSLETASFATAGWQQNDPLSFRPNPDAMKDDDSTLSSDDEDGDESGDTDSSDGESENGEDDDLAAAKATLHMARENKRDGAGKKDGDGVYRAPRMAAMPYPAKGESNEKEKQKRLKRRMRNTELVQALRDQYGDAPEQEDYHGGSAFGKQREAARRLAERQEEKTQFEEDHMIRLQTSRKEKKEKRRLMREESSNLAAMTDLGNLVRGVSNAFGDGQEKKGRDGPVSVVDGENDLERRPRKRGKVSAKNSFQEALFGGSKKKKKKGKR